MLATLATDDLRAVRELERLRIEATRQNDANVLAPLFHERLIYINSAGATSTRNIIFEASGRSPCPTTATLTYGKPKSVCSTM